MELQQAAAILRSAWADRAKCMTPLEQALFVILRDLQVRVGKIDGTIIDSPGCGLIE